MVTIVLVHGSFADGSSWNAVIGRLLKRGYSVVAPSNPLRGLEHDSAYVTSLVEQIAGPVVLVGHSYAGAVISNVAPKTRNVAALVFVAAFATDEGERLGDVTKKSKDAILGPALVAQNYPTDAGKSAVELVVDSTRMHEVFAADLSADTAALLAATQRPQAAAAFDERSGPPLWKSVKSWAVVATSDKAAGTDIVRQMAQRAGARITEVDSSHVVMVSHPDVVADVIVDAARAAEPLPAAR